MNCQLFLESHVPAVFDYEKNQLGSDLSEIQAEMKSWDQSWRKESLDHYSKLGWSFVAQEGETIRGYVLAQPILYFNNWTQTLWVEYLKADDPKTAHELMDVVIRWSKSKHLQKVILNGEQSWSSEILESWQAFKKGSFYHLSTTKLTEDA